jgi:hypothetical protein
VTPAALLCLALLRGLSATTGPGCGYPGPEPYEPRTFLGYACQDDCGRHKAGFLWAEQHAVRDERTCESLEPPESEGCRAYVDESFDVEAAGDRWAIENEIAHRFDCSGAGERFYAGCVRQLREPINTY